MEGRCARRCRAFCFPLFATFFHYFPFRKFEGWDNASDYLKNVLWSKLQLKDGVIAKGVKQEMDVIVIKVRALHDVLRVVPGFCFNLELKLRNWIVKGGGGWECVYQSRRQGVMCGGSSDGNCRGRLCSWGPEYVERCVWRCSPPMEHSTRGLRKSCEETNQFGKVERWM